jgi:hypothetical protein
VTVLSILSAFVAGCGGSTVPEEAPAVEPVPRELIELRERARPTGLKVVVVGIDGATWRVLDPMLAEGALPTLARLRDSGAAATLSARSPMWSAALWTTIATGHPRERHGIGFFLAPESTREKPSLVTRRHRRTLALWNITSFFGLRNAVVGWWVTWPAERVAGVLVSDRFARSRWSAWTDGYKATGLSWPDELAAELRPLIVDPSSPPLDELRKILPMTASQEEEMLAAEKPIFHHGPSVLNFAWCAQRTYERIGLSLVPDDPQADLSMLFLIASDPVSHTYWHYHEPEAFPGLGGSRPGPGDPLRATYEHDDAYLDELFRRLDPDTVKIVISDHGFRASGKLPEEISKERYDVIRAESLGRGVVTVGQTGVHHPDGILIASGHPFREGVTIEAKPLDVAPTILYLLGLPIPEEMPGRILTDALDPGWVAAHPAISVPRFEGIVPPPTDADAELPASADEEDLERLRALGYVR